METIVIFLIIGSFAWMYTDTQKDLSHQYAYLKSTGEEVCVLKNTMTNATVVNKEGELEFHRLDNLRHVHGMCKS